MRHTTQYSTQYNTFVWIEGLSSGLGIDFPDDTLPQSFAEYLKTGSAKNSGAMLSNKDVLVVDFSNVIAILYGKPDNYYFADFLGKKGESGSAPVRKDFPDVFNTWLRDQKNKCYMTSNAGKFTSVINLAKLTYAYMSATLIP
jgi:hypothetical protein